MLKWIHLAKKEFLGYCRVESVTMTFGLASYGGICDVEKMIQTADADLYEGKKEGRNRIILRNEESHR